MTKNVLAVLPLLAFGRTASGQVQSRDTVRLDSVSVFAKAPSTSLRLREFELRKDRAVGGTFISQSEIERRHPSRVTDIFRGIPSVRLIDSAGVKLLASSRGLKASLVPPPKNPRLEAVGRGGNNGGIVDCVLRVAVDGQVKGWGYDLNDLAPEELFGIEIYPGPSSIPSQYGGMGNDKGCGMVLLWTRSGDDQTQKENSRPAPAG